MAAILSRLSAPLPNKKMERPITKFESSIILEGYRGSISHGTYAPTGDKSIDDKDIIGIAIPPLDYFFGLKKFEQIEIKQNEWDILIYDIRKYFRLLIKSNPNVLCLLWLEPHLYTKITPLGQRILDNRELFLSNECYRTFCGYASGQLKKIDRDKKNISNLSKLKDKIENEIKKRCLRKQ